MKVAVAAGSARRGVVGDPAVQLLEVLAGGLLDRVAATEQAAVAGQVVIERATLDRLAGRVQVVDPTAPVGVVTAVPGAPATGPPAPPPTCPIGWSGPGSSHRCGSG